MRKMLVYVAGGCLAICSCAAAPYSVKPVRNERYVKAGFLDYSEKGTKPGFSHPADVKLKTLEAAMSSIVFREEKVLRSKEPRRVFADTEIEQLAPQIKELLAEASPDTSVYFVIERTKGEGVSLFSRITSGQVFVRGNELHFVFGEIQREKLEDEKRGGKIIYPFGDPSRTFRKNWVILENNIVHLAPLPGEEGRKHSQHIVIDMSALKDLEKDIVADKKIKKNSEETDAIEAKLKKLKKLYDKGLIDKDDYRKKKEEILKGL